MDAAEVESGELRWPPDEPSSPDGQNVRKRAEEQTAGKEEQEVIGWFRVFETRGTRFL